MTRTRWLAVGAALGAALGALVAARAGATVLVACPDGTSCERAPVGYEPSYPTGGTYDLFIANANGTDIPDRDGDGAYNDERCDANRKAELAEIASVLGIIVAGGATCEALPAGPDVTCTTPPIFPAPGPQEYCMAAFAVPATALELNAIDITRCDIQDANVNGAEIEAAYENTKLVMSRDLEQDLRECNQLVGIFLPRTVGGRLEEVRAFVALRLDAYREAALHSAEDLSKGLARAAWWFARGEARQADGRFKDAYRSWCRSYRELKELPL